jgi:hypothetical protein
MLAHVADNATMLLHRYPIRKTVAWILPFCFTACFVACLCKCSDEDMAGVAIPAQQTSDILSSLDGCEGCSIIASAIVLPQRPPTADAHTINRPWRAPVTLSGTVLTAGVPTPDYMLFSSTSPPIESLCVIRI